MYIKRIKIENFKSLEIFEVDNLSKVAVFAGPNGAGKSSVLDAILIWKECNGPYNTSNWYYGKEYGKLIRKGKEFATIEVEFVFTNEDIDYLKKRNFNKDIKEGNSSSTKIKIDTTGYLLVDSSYSIFNEALGIILSFPDREKYKNAFIMDYYSPHRFLPIRDLNIFDSSVLLKENQQNNCIQKSNTIQQKGDIVKEYLYQLYQNDLEWFDEQRLTPGIKEILIKDAPDSFKKIREIINYLLPNLNFDRIKTGSPIRILFSTIDCNDIDIDDLSSGEKEILSLFIEIYRKKISNSIIILDEPELHLNQAVESKIWPCLEKYILRDNQIFIVTHSTGILANLPQKYLYRVDKAESGKNQCKNINSQQAQIDTLKSIVGDLGIFTTANKFVFLEGTGSKNSFDKYMLESFFPEYKGKVNYISSGSCVVVDALSEKIQSILEAKIPFGDFYAIRDRDRLSNDEICMAESKITNFKVWNRTMLENYLLDIPLWKILLRNLGVKTTNINGDFISAADDIKDEEYNLRISEYYQSCLKVKDFRDNIHHGTIDKLSDLKKRIENAEDEFEAKKKEILSLINQEILSLDCIRTFHGKNLLHSLKNTFRIKLDDSQLYPLLINMCKENNLIPEDLKEIVNGLLYN